MCNEQIMECSILEDFTKDETYRPFCENDFDAKSFATRVIKSHAVSQQLSTLAQGISLLDKELNQQVSDHYEDLMSQATGIEALEGVLQVLQTRSQSLLAAVEKIRYRVVEPHNKIVARTLQLRRIQETCDMLRQLVREMYLSRRLHLQVSAGCRDATKAAQSLNELEYLSSNGLDLSGIVMLEGERKFVTEARLEVRLMAEKMMQEAMLAQNQSQVATSLQIFFNLNLLETTTDNFVKENIEKIEKTVKGSLDVSSVSSSNDKKGVPGRMSGMAGNSAVMRASLWTNLEKLADDVYTSYSQVMLIQKVLCRKKDPVSHVLFIDHLRESKGEGYGKLTEEFWQGFTMALKGDLTKASEVSLMVKQALESEYPKLLRLFLDLFSRIQSLDISNQLTHSFDQSEMILQKNDGGVSNGENGLPERCDVKDPQQQLIGTFQKFENAYLSRSLSRLFDPINLVFSSSSSSLSSSLPSSADQEAILKTMSSELMVSCFDSRLSELVARNVSKTITMLCTKYEQQVITSGEAIQLSISSPSANMMTDEQVRNIDIINSLLLFYQTALKAFKNLSGVPPNVVNHLKESLKHVISLVQSVLEPLLVSMETCIEEIVYDMHNEDFSMPLPATDQAPPSSSYMEALRKFISQVMSSHLQRVSNLDIIQPRLNQIAHRCLQLFVRHASLVYPVGEGGKLKLSGDFSKVELAIKPLCGRPSDLGSAYRLVRAARPIMFQSTDLIASSTTTTTTIIPLSTILHFLFSRGQPNLRPPYQTAGWSVGRYSKWMDDHQEEHDRLLFIKGSLESYEQSVRSRGGKQFVDVYPVMLDMLQKAL